MENISNNAGAWEQIQELQKISWKEFGFFLQILIKLHVIATLRNVDIDISGIAKYLHWKLADCGNSNEQVVIAIEVIKNQIQHICLLNWDTQITTETQNFGLRSDGAIKLTLILYFGVKKISCTKLKVPTGGWNCYQ